MTLVVEVGARCQSRWLRCCGLHRGSHAIVGGTIYPYHRAVSGQWFSYPLSPFEAMLSCLCVVTQVSVFWTGGSSTNE